MMRHPFLLLAVIAEIVGCADAIKHDEVLAGKRAVEFAEVAFVRQDVEKAYALLSGSAKAYVPLDKFRETLMRLRPSGRPTSVIATEYEPMPGEKAIYIYTVVKNSDAETQYTVTMEGTAATGYRVSKITRGSASYLPSTAEKKRFANPITSQR
jgi:hypothetical protein